VPIRATVGGAAVMEGADVLWLGEDDVLVGVGRRTDTLAAAQLRDSIAAYCDGQLDAALRIQARDTDLDHAYEAFTQRIIARMETDSEHVKDYVDLLFATRFIERIGDQSVNIAEDTVYHLTAMDIRHGGALPPGGAA
jgi:phosphate uptake regulator